MIKDDILPPEITLRVCDGVSCELFGANDLYSKLEMFTNKNSFDQVPCVGRCEQAPVAVINQNPIPFANRVVVDQSIVEKNLPIPSLIQTKIKAI